MKKISLILFVMLVSWSSFSQSSDKREKIKALKVAFLTEQLELNEKEAQKLWPIYNAYEAEKDLQRKLGLEKHKQISEDISETQAKAILDELITYEKKRQVSREDYITNLLKVLPAKKIIKLKMAEDEFNRKMLHEYKKRHGEGHKDDKS